MRSKLPFETFLPRGKWEIFPIMWSSPIIMVPAAATAPNRSYSQPCWSRSRLVGPEIIEVSSGLISHVRSGWDGRASTPMSGLCQKEVGHGGFGDSSHVHKIEFRKDPDQQPTDPVGLESLNIASWQPSSNGCMIHIYITHFSVDGVKLSTWLTLRKIWHG